MTNNQYFLATGENDRQRLEILNKMYNYSTLDFLIASGLKKGMTILEYGCGAGFLTVELAKHVGSTGRVIAIDSSLDSLQVAQEIAKKAKISNIEFKKDDVDNLSHLDIKVDLVYGRWALIYSSDLPTALKKLVYKLKPGGILACEELDFAQNCHFSYPVEPLLNQYHEFAFNNCLCAGLNPDTACQLYHEFKQLSLENLYIKTNQPIRITPEEKSSYRLGLLAMFDTILQNKLCTKDELLNMIESFRKIEESDTIIGGFRNILISGTKK